MKCQVLLYSFEMSSILQFVVHIYFVQYMTTKGSCKLRVDADGED